MFMKTIRYYNIDYHISEPKMQNQNPVEGCIRELRKKWYRVMVKQRVPQQLWDYGIAWISETTSSTHTSAGGINGIPITHVTGETPDISNYLDFGFYDRVWWRDNAGLAPQEPGRWLGISSRTGRSMCYHILTQRGSIVSRSTVQRVTNLELQTDNVKSIFNKYDETVASKIQSPIRHYSGDKPDPDDWKDYADDIEFQEEFNRVYNSQLVSEADSYTPEVADDTYLGMELALPRDSEGPEYARVTKRLRDANGLPIGTSDNNPILDTRLYEVEYPDGYKTSMAANSIAENLFAQIDQEGNRFVAFDSIMDHRTDGTEIKPDNAFIRSK